ncbi:hypothetical protein MNBD_GAMMA21-1844 [hydrothermal vent metagenome]|uniref:J domain-containing protein n=1 Tax=hydrothermal vent metagenome TaxID=652676 RepID=A0A3B1AS85_9ZZZZ
MNSRECLSLLNLSPDSSGQDIKLAYRKAVKQWHPDRHQQASAMVKEKAERKMQDLNTAYSTLTRYYDQHGHLPGFVPPEVVAAAVTDTTRTPPQSTEDDIRSSYREPQGRPHTTESQYQKPVPKKSSSGLIWFSVILLTIIVFYSFDNIFEDNNNENIDIALKQTDVKKQSPGTNGTASPTEPNEKHVEEDTTKAKSPFDVKKRTSAFAPSSELGIYEEAEDTKFFTYGDTGGRVFEIQGVPTKTVGDIWYYGQSEVHFQDGRVKSWVKLDNKLKARK